MAQDNPSRDAILGRIRSALAKSAPACQPRSDEFTIIPAIADVLHRLRAELAANGVECILTGDSNESARVLRDAISALPSGEIFVQDAPELRAVVQEELSGRPIRWSCDGAPAEGSVATITLAEALVASTGSVAVSSRCGGRAGSIIAPCHFVYSKTSQIVPDLDAAMAHINKADLLRNSFVGFITGASRTGDIEKIVVHGAHGPRKVVVVLQRD